MTQSEVIFSFDGNETIIQCNENDKIKDIFSRFINKRMIDGNDVYCLYSGTKMNLQQDLTFINLANTEDKSRKKMNILVYKKETSVISYKIFMVSQDVICPICKEICQLEFKDYKINLFGCKNGHKTEGIPLDQFDQEQEINISKIICEKCKIANKSKVNNNQFYRCLDCKMNLCPLCKSGHENDHNIIDYDEINYFCFHNEQFVNYCKTCKQNICMTCSLEHENHELISFTSIYSNKEKLLSKLNERQELINSLLVDKEYNEVNKILIKIKENFQICLKIQKRIVNNFSSKHRNYQILMNLKEINKDDMFSDLGVIINEDDSFLKFNNILKIYSKMLSLNFEQIGSIENDNKNLKKENKDLKESHDQIKNENNDLCITIQNQNTEIKKLKKEKEMKDTKVNQLSLIEKKFLSLKNENEKKELSYKISLKKLEDSNKNLIKQNKILFSEKEELEREKEELEAKIEELEEENEESEKKLDKEQKEELKKKLDLIKEIINYGINQKDSIDENNNPANKCLLIELIALGMIKTGKGALSMLLVDRKDFAPVNPYLNKAMRINEKYKVNISAPNMHANALEYLSDYCTENSRILDIGSGTGYLTCALSALTNYKGLVVGVEHIQEIIELAEQNIRKNHRNLLVNKKIIFVNSDGRHGYKELGPYKAIHVGACLDYYPDELIQQLDYNGRMFIPIAQNDGKQNIWIIDKDKFGKVTEKSIMSVTYGMLTDVWTQMHSK